MIAAALAGLFLSGALMLHAPEEVTLGEPVTFAFTFYHEPGPPDVDPDVPPTWGNTRFTIDDGAHKWELRRKPDPVTGTAAPARRETLRWMPVRAGEYRIDCVYRDLRHIEWKVLVKPAKGGARELGARLETTKGPLVVRFLPEAAPNTVATIADLVGRGFFDGLGFHRVIRGFMAQGGDPLGTGEGGPGFTIPAEFSSDPRFAHEPGRLSMARDDDPDSAGSQFFICFKKVPRLDGKYTVFGELVEGKDALERIEAIGAEKDPAPPSEIVTITKAALVPLGK